MLTFEECCSMCGLTEQTVAAVAEHENIPEMVALELAAHLLAQPGGARRIAQIIEEDIAAAHCRHDEAHEAALLVVLRQFRLEHAAELGADG